MPGIEAKREKEKQVVGLMIRLYCYKKYGKRQGLCPQCQELYDYACRRSDCCPFMETKTFCSNCKVHCYRADMRQEIRKVMAFSGPRMLFCHPVIAIRHLVETRKEKKKMEESL